jgi:hypothetical protein
MFQRRNEHCENDVLLVEQSRFQGIEQRRISTQLALSHGLPDWILAGLNRARLFKPVEQHEQLLRLRLLLLVGHVWDGGWFLGDTSDRVDRCTVFGSSWDFGD